MSPFVVFAETNVPPETLLGGGVVGLMLVGVSIITGYVLSATRDIKKSYTEATASLEERFERNEETIKKNYEEILAAKEQTLRAIIAEKTAHIEAQKAMYYEMIETRTETIWKPLEKKLIDANREADRLTDLINRLREETNEQRDRIRNLQEYEEKFIKAVEYINDVIKKLTENELEVPLFPESIKHELSRSYRISIPEGRGASITRQDDDIIIEENHEHEQRRENG